MRPTGYALVLLTAVACAAAPSPEPRDRERASASVSGALPSTSAAASASPVDELPPADPAPTLVIPAARKALSDRAQQLALSESGRCLLLAQGRVACWGGHMFKDDHPPLASELAQVRDWVELSMYGGGVCGVTSTGRVECVADRNGAVSKLTGLSDVAELDGRCARTKQGAVFCDDDDVRLEMKGLAGATRLFTFDEGACSLSKSGAACMNRSDAKAKPAEKRRSGLTRIDDADEMAVARGVFCAHVRDGRVLCRDPWGYGQPTELVALRGSHGLAVQPRTACAIAASGSVVCEILARGADEAPTQPGEDEVFKVEGTAGAKHIVLGGSSGAALLESGNVVAFSLRPVRAGYTFDSKRRTCFATGVAQVCFATGDPRAPKIENVVHAMTISGLEDAVEIASDFESTFTGTFCGRRRDGHVVCFAGPNRHESATSGGRRVDLERWDGTMRESAPSVIEGLRGTKLVAGANHACVLGADGQARCWGDGRFGQLGDGLLRARTRHAAIPGLQAVTAIAASDFATFVLVGGELRCSGLCISAPSVRNATPLRWENGEGEGAQQIAAGGWSLCWWKATGDATCRVGDNLSRATTIPLGAQVAELAFGSSTVLARTRNGRLHNGNADSSSLKQVGSDFEALYSTDLARVGGKLVQLELGGQPLKASHKPSVLTDVAAAAGPCVLSSKGEVQCVRSYGEPYKPVTLPRRAKQIVAGRDFACALLDDDSVACWGRTDYGQLGNGVSSTSTEPWFVHGLP